MLLSPQWAKNGKKWYIIIKNCLKYFFFFTPQAHLGRATLLDKFQIKFDFSIFFVKNDFTNFLHFFGFYPTVNYLLTSHSGNYIKYKYDYKL